MLIVPFREIAATGAEAHPHSGINCVESGTGCIRNGGQGNLDARVLREIHFFQRAEDAVFVDGRTVLMGAS